MRGAWARLVDETRAWPGTTVISHENFSTASPEQAKAAVTDLDFAEVHLVLTVRDLARQIPAAWQEDIKNRHVLGFADYVLALREDRRIPQVTGFWRMQDPVDVLARWGESVPPERIHVVTVPPADAPRESLWRRFAELTGIDPAACDVAEVDANPSLGVVEAAMLRRVNRALNDYGGDSALDRPAYERYVKDRLTSRVLRRRPGGGRPRLPAAEYPWVAERSAATVRALREAGYAVVGDLAELLPAAPAAGDAADAPPHPDDVAESAVAATAVESAAFLLTELAAAAGDAHAARAELARERAEHARARQALDELRAEVADDRAKPIYKMVVRRLSERHPLVMRLRVAYWHLVEHLRDRRGRLKRG
ncbi:MAG TPA: hypothetical protein VFU43_30810 [Streptosporangiaceae bacterium]|nr:hypothetical protein [Streptosporangiaceae bacterium]